MTKTPEELAAMRKAVSSTLKPEAPYAAYERDGDFVGHFKSEDDAYNNDRTYTVEGPGDKNVILKAKHVDALLTAYDEQAREIERLREELRAERSNPFKPDGPVYGPIKR